MKTSAKVLMQPFVILVLIAGALGLGLPIQSAIAKPAAQTTNLALNKPVTCSPTPQFPCAEAVDGNLGTRWASAQGVDPQWIYVDLGATYTVSSVILRWEAAYATAFQIQTSGAAGGPWTNIYSTTTGTGGVQTLTVSGSGRYVRMNGTARATIYGYSLWEFEVYGTSGGATATRTNTPLGPTATRTNTPLGPTATRTNTPSGSTNLALNKPVTCSSIENAGTPCASAVDGNTGTRWSSAASDPQWIYVDLGATATIGQVILRWETAYASAFQIQTSGAAGGPWTNIYSTTTGTGGTQTINVSGSGRYIRMYGTTRATVWGYSLWEFEVYGTGGATATNTPVGPSNTPVPPTPTRTPTSPSGGSCGTTSNIALNHPAYAWYWDTGGGAPQYAVDGNGTTRYSHLWYPSGPATGWWYVDLGSTAATITGINITWETAVASGFNLQVSNDTVNWTTIQTVSGNTSLTTNYTYSPARVGRYVRINLLTKGTAWGYSFFEFQVIGCNGAAASYTPPPGPWSGTDSLVWSAHFDGTALNTSNWAYDNNVHVNGEAQQYVSNNVTVSGGILRITAKKEINNGYQFTSGRIFTHHLKTWKYGKFIARMLLPVGEGYWPAFWMMGEDIDTVGWPGTGETDIMENIGYANWVSGALHGPGYWGAGSIGGQHILPNGGTIAAWHDYAVEWDPTYIKWYIDNILVRTVNRTDVTANGSQWVYGNNKFILLNLALGGEYPAGYNGCTGSPLPAGCPYFGIKQATVDNIVAGQGVVQVDYVQVWQKP
jgi:beta-glucanase (GH16 family)